MEYEEITGAVLKDSGTNGRKMGYYDLIGNRGHELSKDELIRIIKEMDYAMYTTLDVSDYNDVIDESIEALKEYYIDDNITINDIETELE